MWKTLAGVPEQSGSTNSPGLQARFSRPSGIVVDAAGNSYIADPGNHVVRRISPEGIVATLAGTPEPGFVNSLGGLARFSSPSGVVRDAAGNLYVADRDNNAIRKVLPSQWVETFAGQAVAGSDDATGTAAKFNSPAGLTIDASGNLYVTDSGNHTIRRITPGGVVSTLAGMPGISGTANGTGTAARFNTPESIALHPDGTLLVTELNNHSIRRVTMAGVVTTFAGQVGTPGSGGGTTATASFRSPTGITVAPSGMVYLVDSENNLVRQITTGGQVQNLAGQPGAEGAVDGQGTAARFKKPYGVAVTLSGTLIVTDRDNHMMRHVSPTGLVTLFAGQAGSAGFFDSMELLAKFNFPVGITADANGYIYVSDYNNHSIRKVSATGVVRTLAGASGFAGTADGAGPDARFKQPRGLTVDSAGNLFVADTGAHTIRKVTPAGHVSTLAGQPENSGHANATGTNALFNQPTNLKILPNLSGSLIIADMGNHVVRELNLDTLAVTPLAGNPGVAGVVPGSGSNALFSSPCGIGISPNREIFVTNHSGQSVVKMSGGNYGVSVVAGKFQEEGSNDGPVGTSRFRNPASIDSDGFVVVISDTTDNTIRTMLPGSPNTVTTIGGKAGISGVRDGLGQAARFTSPHGVVKAPNGDIYVADSGNHRVVHGKAYASPWLGWLAFHNISSGATGDDDSDGVVNLLEFAFATHPREGTGGAAGASGGVVTTHGMPSVVRETNGSHTGLYAVRFDSNQVSLRYTPQFSSDLTDWSDHTGVLLSRGTDAEVSLLAASFPATLPNGKVPRFFRVVVSQM